MRSLLLMLGVYALYRVVQENSQPTDRPPPQGKPARKTDAAGRRPAKSAG
jgi:hypothetical protein